MKKITLLPFFIGICYTISMAQTQLPNSDFETWQNNYTATPWKAINLIFAQTATKTTDKYQGVYAAKLETKNVFGQIVPGFISLGEMDLSTFMPKGGTPFADRPTGISLYHKYLPAEQDTMLMFALLTKWNSSGGKTDTIGATGFFSGNSSTNYSKLSVPFIYFSEEIPDSINIGFASSLMSPKVGSKLYIDSLTMLYGAVLSPTICLPAIDTTAYSFTASWIPIPDADSYVLDVSKDVQFTNYLTGYENENVGNQPFWTVTTPEPCLFFYRVNPQYGTESGGFSNSSSVPMPTEILDIQNITTTSFSATWAPCEQATTYFLDVSENQDFSTFLTSYQNKNCGNVTQTEVIDLQNNTTYFYRVRAQYGTYLSKNSETAEVTTSTVGSQNISENPKMILTGRNIQIFGGNANIYSIQGQCIAKNAERFTFSHSGIFLVQFNTGTRQTTETIFVK